MMNHSPAFDPAKSVAAIAYLAEKTHERIHHLLLLMYLADKTHLYRYGRTLAFDTYRATALCPVPWSACHALRSVRLGHGGGHAGSLARRYLRCDRECRITTVIPHKTLKDPRALDASMTLHDTLSETDIECLDYVVRLASAVDPRALRSLARDEAWREAWSQARREVEPGAWSPPAGDDTAGLGASFPMDIAPMARRAQ